MLVPAIEITPADDESYIFLKDVTGAYNVSSNPNGYGGPNQAYTGFFILLVRFWGDTDFTPLYYNSILLAGRSVTTGFNITAVELGLDSFSNGVYQFKYLPIEIKIDNQVSQGTQPAGDDTITHTTGPDFTVGIRPEWTWIFFQDRSSVVYTNGSALKAGPYQLIGSVSPQTITVDPVATGANSGFVMGAPEADIKIPFSLPASKCVASRIGRLTYSRIEQPPCVETLNTMTNYLLSAEIDAAKGDFDSAHNMILTVASLCEEDCLCP